jgi:hypothetical protein
VAGWKARRAAKREGRRLLVAYIEATGDMSAWIEERGDGAYEIITYAFRRPDRVWVGLPNEFPWHVTTSQRG